MEILCNGKKQLVASDSSLADLLQSMQLAPDVVVAEVNGQIIQPDHYAGLQLREGDQVELVRFVGGG